MLGRDGHNEVAGTVFPAHVILRFHQMLGDGGTHFVRVAVELQHTFGFGTVGKPVFLQEFAERCLPIGGTVLRLAEKSRGIEREILDPGGKLRARRVSRQVLPCLQFFQSGEHVLEHTGRRAGGRHEFALAVNGGAAIIGGCSLRLLGRKHANAALRRCWSDDLHPRKAVFEMFDLLLDLARVRAPLPDLLDVVLRKHWSVFLV